MHWQYIECVPRGSPIGLTYRRETRKHLANNLGNILVFVMRQLFFGPSQLLLRGTKIHMQESLSINMLLWQVFFKNESA